MPETEFDSKREVQLRQDGKTLSALGQQIGDGDLGLALMAVCEVLRRRLKTPAVDAAAQARIAAADREARQVILGVIQEYRAAGGVAQALSYLEDAIRLLKSET